MAILSTGHGPRAAVDTGAYLVSAAGDRIDAAGVVVNSKDLAASLIKTIKSGAQWQAFACTNARSLTVALIRMHMSRIHGFGGRRPGD